MLVALAEHVSGARAAEFPLAAQTYFATPVPRSAHQIFGPLRSHFKKAELKLKIRAAAVCNRC